MKTKEKILDKLDDLRIFFLNKLEQIRKYYFGIKRSCAYFKTLSNIYDFDYSSVLEVERKQLERLRDSIEYYHHHEDAGRDVERINLALRLLDVIIEDDSPVICNYNSKNIIGAHGWKCIKYVNTRNASRFVSKGFLKGLNSENEDIREIFKAHLYLEKAWYIYHKLRLNWLRSWWD